ncbi:MAG: hypothetical protein KDF65_14450, partial [Anaerolineae bacterium]|nr:hypothetical protein [Anaerolineae bacterium]
MAGSKIPRRVFLKSLGVLLVTGGCTADLGSRVPTEPTLTPLPTPTPTPLPSADGVAQAYLAAWHTGDFAAMYALLTPPSQQSLTLENFRARYLQAMNEATVTEVVTQLQSLLHDGPQASAIFYTTWQTSLFGVIEADNQ